MKNETAQMSLFSQGWKAEVYFGSELTAHHMNTRSVYRFKENANVSITHSGKYADWLDAYYCGVQCVNNLNSDILAAQC